MHAKRPASGTAQRRAASLAFLLVGTATGLWAAHIPGIDQRLALGKASLGLALFALAAGALAAMPLAGRYAQSVGAGRLTLFLALALQATLPLPVLAQGFASLLLACFVFGAAIAGTDIAMNARGAEVERDRPKPIMSSLHGFYSLGGLVGAAAGGAMVRLGFDDGSGMALAGVLGGALLLADRRALGALDPPGPGHASAGPAFRLPRRAEWGLGLLAFLCFLVEGAVVDWSALWLLGSLGARGGTEVLGYALFSVAMAACRFAGDGVVARLGAPRVVRGGGVLIGLGMVLALLPAGFAASSPWLAIGLASLGFGLVGLGAANVVPVAFSAAARRPGLSPAAGIASVATLGYAGFLLGPALLGAVAGAAGLGLALGLLVPMGLVVAFGTSPLRTPGAAS